MTFSELSTLRNDVERDQRRWRKAEEADAQRTRDTEARRQREAVDTQRRRVFDEAKLASIGTGATWTTEIELLVNHVVDLAQRADPRVTLEWLTPGTKSGELIGQDNATSFGRARMVTCWPIVDCCSAAIALHEIGHQRDRTAAPKLDRERSAWSWAREHALIWHACCDAQMRSCLGTYVAGATKRDVPALKRIERFLAEPPIVKPASAVLEQHAARQYQRQHGLYDCEGGCKNKPLAVASFGRLRVCRDCFVRLDTDRRFQHMKRERYTRRQNAMDLERRPAIDYDRSSRSPITAGIEHGLRLIAAGVDCQLCSSRHVHPPRRATRLLAAGVRTDHGTPSGGLMACDHCGVGGGHRPRAAR